MAGGEGVEGGQGGALDGREERLAALAGVGAIAGAVPPIAEAWSLKEALRAICSRSTWSVRGAKFLTPPQHRGREIRCYLRDLDGHLIEVGHGRPTGAERVTSTAA